MSTPRYGFERDHNIHETRDTAGLNRLRPASWLRRNDRIVQLRTTEALLPWTQQMSNPTVLVIGVGQGGIYEWMWREPGTLRLGLDVNHEVMRMTLSARADHYHAVEGDAGSMPFPDGTADVVFFDFSLHHLVGQGSIGSYIREAARVTRPGGLLIAREPSSLSPSGVLLNLLNRFALMNRLSGASNQEFALRPSSVEGELSKYGDIIAVRGLSYLFAHRFPPVVQRAIEALDQRLFRGRRAQHVADFVLYVARAGEWKRDLPVATDFPQVASQ